MIQISQAIIFDLDGLLTDTETLHRKSYQATLAAEGYALSDQEFDDHWIRDGKNIADLCKLRGIMKNPKHLHEDKVVRFSQLLATDLRPMPGAVNLLKRVHGRKRTALATASAKECAIPVLETLGLLKYFEVVLTAADVARRKPHPDLFLLAAARLNVEPKDCVVLEDAEKGIIAAHAAGMRSIAIPTASARRHDFSLATHVAENLADVPDAWLGL